MRKKITRRRRYRMARRRNYRRYAARAYGGARRAYRGYRRRGGAGGFRPVINGLIAGVVANLAVKYIGSWGAPAANIGAGWWLKNDTLKTIGGIQLGNVVSGMIPFIGSSNGSKGVY